MSPLIDFSQKDATGNPKIIQGGESIYDKPIVTDHDVTLKEPPEDVTNVILDEPPSDIDCSNIPNGRWGLDKIHAWFDENGIGYGDVDTKDELIADAKTLCAEQETS